MATTKNIKLTVGTKPLSAAASKRVHSALKKTLQAELAREGATLGGIGNKALDISGHGKGSAANIGSIATKTAKGTKGTK
ncbi:MAG TPA: hypothetical protein VGN86_10020 [Pyrinomonadaceae bacterium]|nr:hypothetical protein [Pyrinomonadaceae bacterium]